VSFRPDPMPCPACGADVLGTGPWTEERFAAWRKPGRTPIFPECAEVLIIGDDLELRRPFPVELVRVHATCDDLEAIQALILERRRLAARKDRDE
jgi:hypothetical protein